jgi:hypothetical protein
MCSTPTASPFLTPWLNWQADADGRYHHPEDARNGYKTLLSVHGRTP